MENKSEISVSMDGGTKEKVYAKQMDNGTRLIKIKLISNGTQLIPTSNQTVLFRYVKSDGKSGMYQVVPEKNGVITIILSNQVLAVSGPVHADIAVIEGEKVLSTSTFEIDTSLVPISKDEMASSNEFTYLVEIGKRANESVIKAEDAAKRAAQSAIDASTAIGSVFTPHVSEDGILSFTNNKGLPNPKPIKIVGETVFETAKNYGYNDSLNTLGNIIAKAIPFISPKSFGAVGDGIHDDTDAFKATLNFAESYNLYNKIYIPRGTYIVNDPLVLNNINMEGEGRDNTILKCSLRLSKNVKVCNVSFILNGRIYNNEKNVENIIFDNCSFDSDKNADFYFNDAVYKNIKWKDCQFNGLKHGFKGISMVCKCLNTMYIEDIHAENCIFFDGAHFSCIGRRYQEGKAYERGWKNISLKSCIFEGKENPSSEMDITVSFDSPDLNPLIDTALPKEPLCGGVKVSDCVINNGYYCIENAGCKNFVCENNRITANQNTIRAISQSRLNNIKTDCLYINNIVKGSTHLCGNNILVNDNTFNGEVVIHDADNSAVFKNNMLSNFVADSSSPIIINNKFFIGDVEPLTLGGHEKGVKTIFYNNAFIGDGHKFANLIAGGGSRLKEVDANNNYYNGTLMNACDTAGGMMLYSKILPNKNYIFSINRNQKICIKNMSDARQEPAIFKVDWNSRHSQNSVCGSFKLNFFSYSVLSIDPVISGDNIQGISVTTVKDTDNKWVTKVKIQDLNNEIQDRILVKMESIVDTLKNSSPYKIYIE